MVFPASGLALGTGPEEEFAMSVKEAKLKVASGDAVLFFNQAILSKVPLDRLKDLMKENADLSASALLEVVKRQFTNPGQDEIFLFLIKKI